MIFSLYVPRVYDNSESKGYRKYQRQRIEGEFYLGFNVDGEAVGYLFKNFINRTHILSNGKHVTYDVILDENAYFPRFNAIGSNKTGVFKVPSLCFSIIAEPSYNVGEIDEDTSLYITLAGKGQFKRNGKINSISGYASGTLGCGCKDYGHISPTRTIGPNGPTDIVVDVAAVYGNWGMKLMN